ncbi:MAG TPA: M48 family metalloprotease [Ferruginibacter sp.]|nr:M48 family metalloprotease [Ferruginibacter sp.]HRO06742.1 M48 family metalloprotease [Ferruginibacter sp.]HRO97139.1 M48 family metalloprotease [Ferruginibacter sp.]HRP49595.1 M48 family metalloprotease [Ferruginibacter sp.]
MRNIFSLVGVVTAAMLITTGCSKNPVTGKKQLTFMSEQQEIALGKEADPQIIAQYGLYEDKVLQDFINEKGKAMAAISHRPKLEYSFRIVDSDIINAFAVPGGYVYFTRGIMAHFNDEAQFAGVLGHEIGHITARHSVIQQRNAMLGNIGLIAGVVIKPELARFAESASQGMQLLFLKFGRDDEKQSDELGVEYSSKIGYDATHMADFFTTLDRQSARAGGGNLPEFLSTHPNPDGRHDQVLKLAREWKAQNPNASLAVNRNAYLKRIDGIVFGPDPRQGFLERSVFYHPELKFQWSVPSGWSYQNSPTMVQVAEKNGKALLQLSTAKAANPREAAQMLVTNNNLQVLDARATTVHGHQAYMMVADVPATQQSPALRIQTYHIQKDQLIYQLLGVAASSEFSAFVSQFTQSMTSFRTLTDNEKINRKPERVRIKTVTQDLTLEQLLRQYNQPAARFEELAILNGMQLKDKVSKGTMIKTVGN